MNEPIEPVSEATPVCYRHTDRETWIRCQRCDRPICPDCMRQAAVGFQCPSCVKEGARSTRSGRLPYGGIRSGRPMLVTWVLLGINVAIWVGINLSSRFLDAVALMPQGRCEPDGARGFFPGVTEAQCDAQASGVHWVAGVATGAPWQVITSAFAHQEIWHIGMNMLALYILGAQVEQVLGAARYLAVYLVSALTGSLAVMWLAAEQSQTLGASGAIFGLMGALFVISVRIRINLQPILTLVVINVLFTALGSSFISWQGHLGGFLGGAALTAAMVFAPRGRSRSALQWSATAVLALGSLALIAMRATALA